MFQSTVRGLLVPAVETFSYPEIDLSPPVQDCFLLTITLNSKISNKVTTSCGSGFSPKASLFLLQLKIQRLSGTKSYIMHVKPLYTCHFAKQLSKCKW